MCLGRTVFRWHGSLVSTYWAENGSASARLLTGGVITPQSAVRLNDDQRRRLAAQAKGLGQKLLAEMATIVTPERRAAGRSYWARKLYAALQSVRAGSVDCGVGDRAERVSQTGRVRTSLLLSVSENRIRAEMNRYLSPG